eukprot:13334687-Ditylum_brightwellii.AAC.1
MYIRKEKKSKKSNENHCSGKITSSSGWKNDGVSMEDAFITARRGNLNGTNEGWDNRFLGLWIPDAGKKDEEQEQDVTDEQESCKMKSCKMEKELEEKNKICIN